MITNELTKPTATSLVLRRTFSAPCDRVFSAWLSPDIMRGFLFHDRDIVELTVDPRVGGSYRISFAAQDGSIWTVGGVYREIITNQRIVCTWTWEEDDPGDVHETLLTLEFHSFGSKTELVFTHTKLRNEESRDDSASGWTEIFDRLGKIISGETSE